MLHRRIRRARATGALAGAPLGALGLIALTPGVAQAGRCGGSSVSISVGGSWGCGGWGYGYGRGCGRSGFAVSYSTGWRGYCGRRVYRPVCRPVPVYRYCAPRTRVYRVCDPGPVYAGRAYASAAPTARYRGWAGASEATRAWEVAAAELAAERAETPITIIDYPVVIAEAEPLRSAGAPIAPAASPAPGVGVVVASASTGTDPWGAMLAAPGASADAFAARAAAQPDDAAPKVGFALANALGGDVRTAGRALRRALIVDAPGVGEIEIDARVARAISVAIGEDLEAAPADAERWLLRAAASMLAGDRAAAATAIDRARSLGEDHPASRALSGLIRAMEGAGEAPSPGSSA